MWFGVPGWGRYVGKYSTLRLLQIHFIITLFSLWSAVFNRSALISHLSVSQAYSDQSDLHRSHSFHASVSHTTHHVMNCRKLGNCYGRQCSWLDLKLWPNRTLVAMNQLTLNPQQQHTACYDFREINKMQILISLSVFAVKQNRKPFII